MVPYGVVEGKDCGVVEGKLMMLFYDGDVEETCLENVSDVSLVGCTPHVEHSFVAVGKARVGVCAGVICGEEVIASLAMGSVVVEMDVAAWEKGNAVV